PGPVCCRSAVARSPLGLTTTASRLRKFRKFPFASRASTLICPSPLSTVTSVLKSAVSTLRKLHWAACDQNWRYLIQVNQFCPHLARASEVNATARPRPYCQWARIGSPFSETSGVSARALGVVATYPSSRGNSAAL